MCRIQEVKTGYTNKRRKMQRNKRELIPIKDNQIKSQTVKREDDGLSR